MFPDDPELPMQGNGGVVRAPVLQEAARRCAADCAKKARDPGRRGDVGGPADSSRQPPGKTPREAGRAALDPGQRSVEDLFCLAGRERIQRGDG
jgi:hypothetical protein